MPTYDVSCFSCSFQTSVVLSIAALEAWDESAICPACQKGGKVFRRIIRSAAAGSTRPDNWSRFASKSANPDQVASAFENVKTGKFEDF